MNEFGKVVLLKPGKDAEITEIDLSLEGMQKTVGGLIQAVYPWDDDAVLICNDEGKILGLPPCRAIFKDGDNGTEVEDIVHGDFFICRQDGENLVGLTDELAEKYFERFKEAEWFFLLSEDGNVGRCLVCPRQNDEILRYFTALNQKRISYIGPGNEENPELWNAMINFNPVTAYPHTDGVPVMSEDHQRTAMFELTQLSVEMRDKGASNEEFVRLLKHSAVVLDARKHKLNWAQSYIDNGIEELKQKYMSK